VDRIYSAAAATAEHALPWLCDLASLDGKLVAVASSRSRPCAAAAFRARPSAAWIQTSLTETAPKQDAAMSDLLAPIGGVTGAAALQREARAQDGGGWMNRAACEV
jgi:hypothetical protein